ncbi:MAG: COX15/CtaA family protein, partial [Elusimicrobia bacterium]|nr:COX15/CtaA family protein [Elusimicrobiota bacterium]
MGARTKGLHLFSRFTAVSTFFLILAGATVTSTGSGLSVPDWPLSYGQFFPPMVGGVFFEHGHRMIAGTVGLLTSVLLFWVLAQEPRTWVRVLACSTWFAVLTQAILGGITVLYQLPKLISIAHACLAQIFFCLLVTLSAITSPSWLAPSPQP